MRKIRRQLRSINADDLPLFLYATGHERRHRRNLSPAARKLQRLYGLEDETSATVARLAGFQEGGGE